MDLGGGGGLLQGRLLWRATGRAGRTGEQAEGALGENLIDPAVNRTSQPFREDDGST